MSNDAILTEINRRVLEGVALGCKHLYFVWSGELLCGEGESIPYADPGFICRIHLSAAHKGLTWRMRQRIGWRLDVLRKKGLIQ